MYVNVICAFSPRCMEMYVFAKCMQMYSRCTSRCTPNVHLDFPEWSFFFPDEDVHKCTQMYKIVHLRCTFSKCTPNVHPNVLQMYSSHPLISLLFHYITRNTNTFSHPVHHTTQLFRVYSYWRARAEGLLLSIISTGNKHIWRWLDSLKMMAIYPGGYTIME